MGQRHSDSAGVGLAGRFSDHVWLLHKAVSEEVLLGRGDGGQSVSV
jgi:hypothetical protein